MIWGGTSYGHIGIFVEGDVNSFKSFDQNYPIGSPAHIQGHTYANVLGWLRPKQIVEDQTCQQELEKVRLERDANWTKFISVCEALGVGANVDIAVAEAKKLVELEDQYNQKDKQLTEAQTKIGDLEQKVVNLSFAQTELVADNEALKSKVAEYEKRIEEQGIEIGSLSTALSDLKQQIDNTPHIKGWVNKLRQILKIIGG
jgi:regulator of replication initiation timing